MSESDQVAEETVAEEPAVEPEAPAAEAGEAEVAEPVAEAEAEPESPEAEAVVEPEAELEPEVVVDDAAIASAEEELAEEAIPAPVGPAAGRQAKVYLCERGHRTVAVWSDPTVCHARPTRSAECGRQLYPIGELPEQVQKALNPLKASKKASKG
jgi:hypothetical protein